MAEFAAQGNVHYRATETASMLRFEDVSLNRNPATGPDFEHLSFMLPPASCIVLTGKLGCGKSAALRMIVGKQKPATGRITVEQTTLEGLEPDAMDEVRQRIGYVPEQGALLSNLNLFENMVLPYRYHCEPTEEEVEQRAAETLEMLRMPPLPRIIPPNASAALRRQVALARALILRPRLLVLDSPVAGMDHNAARDHWRALNRIMLELPVSIVIACEFPPQQANLDHRLIDLGKHVARWRQ